VTTSDLFKATTFGATIFSFNALGKNKKHIMDKANTEKVEVRDHDLLLKLREDIEKVLASALPPVDEEKIIGTAEVIDVITLNGKRRQTFDVAGCKVGLADFQCQQLCLCFMYSRSVANVSHAQVVSGKLRRGSLFHVVRDKEVVHVSDGCRSLRHFKEKVTEIKQVWRPTMLC